MLYRRSKTLIDKNTHVILSVIFTVFIFTQFVSLNHHVEHLNDYNDVYCDQCISTPDQLDDSSVPIFLFQPQERTAYKSAHKTKFTNLTLKAYSARASPSIT